MSKLFEELAYRETPFGALSLRRRWDIVRNVDIYEMKLNEEFLMSSMFTEGEKELAHLGLSGLGFTELDIVVGGLGLGYTAQAALENDRVRSLIVIEAFEEVIQWHREKLVPVAPALASDPRCQLVQGDFFDMVKREGLDTRQPDRRFHAILLDIDHSPVSTLHKSHSEFYTHAGLSRLLDYLHPGGHFALWSNDPPDDRFCNTLGSVFQDAKAHVVNFHNQLQNRDASNTIYVARA